MSPKLPRRWVVWVGLLVVLAWLVDSDRREPAISEARAVIRPAKPPEPKARTEAPAAAQALPQPIPREQLIRPQGSDAAARDLFARHDWSPPAPQRPPPPPAAAAGPPPVPPAPNFQFVGKHLDENGWQVFLVLGDKTHIVKEGQVFHEGYKVESIKPPVMMISHAERPQPIQIGIGEGP
jgi:hypothetical protein